MGIIRRDIVKKEAAGRLQEIRNLTREIEEAFAIDDYELATDKMAELRKYHILTGFDITALKGEGEEDGKRESV